MCLLPPNPPISPVSRCKESDSPHAVTIYMLEPHSCQYILGVGTDTLRSGLVLEPIFRSVFKGPLPPSDSPQDSCRAEFMLWSLCSRWSRQSSVKSWIQQMNTGSSRCPAEDSTAPEANSWHSHGNSVCELTKASPAQLSKLRDS